MYKFFVCVALVVSGSLASPVKDDLMFEGQGDTATVESTVREARAAPSHIGDLIQPGVKDAFLYVYGDAENDDGDVHGYSKKMDDKGQDGYKHYDSFHKRDGDKYGYEKHSEYGQENKAGIDGENEKGLEEAHFEAEGGKHEKDAGDDGEESKKQYSVLEELNDDKKQPKKKVESDYSYFGEGDGGSYYGEGSSDAEAESESEEEDDVEVESEEESEETEEAEEDEE